MDITVKCGRRDRAAPGRLARLARAVPVLAKGPGQVRNPRQRASLSPGGGSGMIDYRILGPLEVSAGGRVIEIGGPKLRVLLVILLLRANQPVPRDVLAHELWGEQPPPGAQGSLDVYVSRLRKALGPYANGSVLITRPGAYSLLVEEGQLDARRFERLVEQGRAALTRNAPDQAAAR